LIRYSGMLPLPAVATPRTVQSLHEPAAQGWYVGRQQRQPQGNHPEPKNRQEAQYPRSDQHDANESPKYRRQVALPPFQKTIAHDDELACTSPFLPTTASFRMPAICRILAQDFLLPFPPWGSVSGEGSELPTMGGS